MIDSYESYFYMFTQSPFITVRIEITKSYLVFGLTLVVFFIIVSEWVGLEPGSAAPYLF